MPVEISVDAHSGPGAASKRSAPQVNAMFGRIPVATVGGMRLAALDREQTAELMVEAALTRRRSGNPIVMSSANGEVVSRVASNTDIASLFEEADLLSADGQPLVLASRLMCRNPLPERVATTDLFHDVARRATERGLTFYILGASAAENARAVSKVKALYPGLEIVGSCHGYLDGDALDAKVDEINELAPDILWVAFGVPREQIFCRRYRSRLGNVGIIKTSGGLLNFLSGTRKRAPGWMQRVGLEWIWRIKEEPRRLFWRYAVTNPHALLLLLRRSA